MFFPYRVEWDEADAEKMPVGTLALMLLNALVFGFLLLLPGSGRLLFMYRFGFAVADGWSLSLLTYMFLHAGWLHLIGNMYFLWLFGRAIEQTVGTAKFVAFYVAAGVVSVLTHAAFVMPETADVPCIGASGAISGVLGAFAVMLPGAYVEAVILLFGSRPAGTIRLRAYFFLAFWFVMQMVTQYAMADPMSPSGVAYGAHIGGFLFGWTVWGLARIARTAARDWRDLHRAGALSEAAQRINAGEALAGAETDDPDVQIMLFLKEGRVPADPGLLSRWVEERGKTQADAAAAASALLREHAEGGQDFLSGAAKARSAHAMAQLGHADLAIACLLDRIPTAPERDLPETLCALGTLLWKHAREPVAAAMCLDKAVAADPLSPAAARARQVRGLINSDQPRRAGTNPGADAWETGDGAGPR